jgi:hypothetical protein
MLNGVKINDKEKEAYLKRMEIIGIQKFEQDPINPFLKTLVTDRHMFSTYLGYRFMVKKDVDETILMHVSTDFPENIIDSFFMKVKYYKQITNVLGIKDYVKFDYDLDKVRFAEKIEDKDLLEKMPEILKLFRKSKTTYNDFDKDKGHFQLYKLAITMCENIFTKSLLTSKRGKDKLYNDNKFVTVTKYKYNQIFINSLNQII